MNITVLALEKKVYVGNEISDIEHRNTEIFSLQEKHMSQEIEFSELTPFGISRYIYKAVSIVPNTWLPFDAAFRH